MHQGFLGALVEECVLQAVVVGRAGPCRASASCGVPTVRKNVGEPLAFPLKGSISEHRVVCRGGGSAAAQPLRQPRRRGSAPRNARQCY